VASVDHVDAGLLFDSRVATNLNLLWCEATTFQSYTGYHPLGTNFNTSSSSSKRGGGGKGRGGGGASSSFPPHHPSFLSDGLHYVLKSLTRRHIELLHLIAHKQLNDPDGYRLDELHKECVKRVMLKTLSSLKSLFVELIDHHLLTKHSITHGAGDYYRIPRSNQELQDILNFNIQNASSSSSSRASS